MCQGLLGCDWPWYSFLCLQCARGLGMRLTSTEPDSKYTHSLSQVDQGAQATLTLSEMSALTLELEVIQDERRVQLCLKQEKRPIHYNQELFTTKASHSHAVCTVWVAHPPPPFQHCLFMPSQSLPRIIIARYDIMMLNNKISCCMYASFVHKELKGSYHLPPK